MGKWNAINIGLKKIKSNAVIMLAGDLRISKNSLKKLVETFKKHRGVVIGRIKADKDSPIFQFSKHIWNLHHLLCRRYPKGTEMMMFENRIKRIDKTAVDEVFIEYLFRKIGRAVYYVEDAVGYTSSPKSLKHFFNQRKRSFIGHLELKIKYKYAPMSFSLIVVLKIYFKYFLDNLSEPIEVFRILIVGFIEFFARLVGLFEYLFLKKVPYKW